MNENDLYVAQEYKIDNSLITDIDSIIDSCFKDCHKKIFTILNMNVYMIINLQVSLIMKNLN